MRSYNTIPVDFWWDASIRRLSGDGKLVALYLVTSPNTNMIGCFPLPVEHALADLGMNQKRFDAALSELARISFASYDDATGWVLVHPVLGWNPVAGPKQHAAALKLLGKVPTSRLRDMACGYLAACGCIAATSDTQSIVYRMGIDTTEPEPEPSTSKVEARHSTQEEAKHYTSVVDTREATVVNINRWRRS